MTNSKHPLKPDETIHKILISTTSRMTGELISDEILISHAWPSFTNLPELTRMEESPISRSGFIVTFKTAPYEKEAGIVVPDYSNIGETVCSYLAVLFGKRFDCHGAIESNGFHHTPDLTAYQHFCNPRLPFNSHKQRNCFKVPLSISNFAYLPKALIAKTTTPDYQTKLNASCKFYMQALQSIELQPEVAYLHLITAGEILANCFDYTKDELLAKQTINDLKHIENKLDQGGKIAKRLSKQLLSIKSLFVKALCSLIDDHFFEHREFEMESGYFKAGLIEKNISSAYDLRSKYIHSGVPFGRWIQPSILTDLQVGQPLLQDKQLSKTLEKAPTFLGLERFIRYCLLKFIASNGAPKLIDFRDNTTQENC